MQEGKIFFCLLVGTFILVSMFSLISAETTYTSTTDTVCNNGVCTKTLYSGVKNVYEDNQWKRVENARSLKGSGIGVAYLEDDNKYPIEIVDFNYSSITVKLNPKGIKIFNEDIPVRVWEDNQTKEKKFYQDLDDGKIISKGVDDYKEKMTNTFEEYIGFNLLNQEETKTYDFGMGKILEFGFNSTTITLQDADSENLDDSWLNEDDPSADNGADEDLSIYFNSNVTFFEKNESQSILKFNISSINDIILYNVTSAILKLRHGSGSFSNPDNVITGIYEVFPYPVYNISDNPWTETTINWNNRPNETNNGLNATYESFKSINSTNDFEWHNFSAINTVANAISLNSEDVSFLVKTFSTSTLASISKYDSWAAYSKEESASPERRPILEIVYDILDSTPPDITINTPINQTYNTDSILFNVTATDNIMVDTCLYSLNNGVINNSMTNTTSEWIDTNSTLLEQSYTAYFYCNDTGGYLNATEQVTFNIKFDSLPPNITSLTENPPNNTTYSPGAIYEFNATITDETGIETVRLEFDGTNYTATNLTADVYNVTLFNLTAGTYNYLWFANDTLGNVNNTENGSYEILSDTEYPQFSNYGSNYTNGTEYWLSKTYVFNVTILSTNGTAGLEFDGVNYTTTNSTANLFEANIGELAVGDYNYQWWAYGNGTSKLYNASAIHEFSVVQNTSYVINITGTKAITFGTAGDFEGINCPSQITCNLFRDNSSVSNPDTTTLGVGTYQYIFNSTGNTNYSSNSARNTLVVSQATTTTTLTVDPASPITYGTASNFSCSNDGGLSSTLYIGGVDRSALDGSLIVYGANAAGYNISCIANGNQNYSGDADETTYIINLATPSGSLAGTSPITFGTAGDVTGSESNTGDADLTYELFRNNASVSNPDTTTLGVGDYSYNYNATAGANYTANASLDTFLLTINNDTTSCDILFNETSPLTYTNKFLVWSNCTSTFTLYRDHNLISNNSAQDLGAGTYYFEVNRTDNQNYTHTHDNESFTIDQSTGLTSLIFDKVSPQDYLTQINSTCSVTTGEGTTTMYRDGVDVTSESGTLVTLGAGTYNYECNMSATQNYTFASNQSTYTINQIASNVTLYLNSTQANVSIPAGNSVNITAILITGENNSILIYSNGTLISNSTSPVQNIKTYTTAGIYNITTYYIGSQNYTGDYSLTWWLNVSESTGGGSLVSNIKINEGSGTIVHDTHSGGGGGSVSGGSWSDDDVNVILTENVDYNLSETTFTIINSTYAWTGLTASYNFAIIGQTKRDINDTIIGISSFSEHIELIVLAIIISIIIGLVLFAFQGGKRR